MERVFRKADVYVQRHYAGKLSETDEGGFRKLCGSLAKLLHFSEDFSDRIIDLQIIIGIKAYF